MSGLLELLLHYQHTGSSLLQHLHSSSTTLEDVMFYSVALTVPLLFFTHPVEVRLLLLLAILASWLIERSIIKLLVPVHSSAFIAASTGSGAGLTAGAHVSSGLSRAAGHVHSVKLCVRLFVMGGTCGLVIWWMVKKSMAKRRREEMFESMLQEHRKYVSLLGQALGRDRMWQQCCFMLLVWETTCCGWGMRLMQESICRFKILAQN